MLHRRPGASTAKVRSLLPPSRARGCRNAGSSRPGCRPESLQHPRMSRWFCWTARDPPIRQGARGCSAQAREHFARGFPPGDAPWVSRKDGEVTVPTGWQLAALHQVDLGRQLGMLSSIGTEEFRPVAPSPRPARPPPADEVLADTVGDEKLRILGPSVAALGKADLLIAERLTMGLRPVLLLRGTVADVAVG